MTKHRSLIVFSVIVIVFLFGLMAAGSVAEESKDPDAATGEPVVVSSEPYYGVDLLVEIPPDCPYLDFTDESINYPPETPPDHAGLSESEAPRMTVVYDVETGEVSVEDDREVVVPPPADVAPWDPPAGWQPSSGDLIAARQLISNTTDYPWRTLVKVFINWPNNTGGGCSGAMLDGNHVLTAGHCIHKDEKGGWATMVRVAPGYNCGTMPYYQAWAVLYRTYNGWSDDENPEHDWAVLTLDRNIGIYLGWMGRITSDSMGWYEGRIFNGAGYPGDLNNGECLYWDVGPGEEAWEYYLATDIDTAPGMSGMPMWTVYGGPYYIASVHTYGSCGDDYGPCSTRLNEDKFDRIPYWLSLDTPPVDKPDLVDAGGTFSGFGPLTVIPAVTWFETWSDVYNIGTAEAMAPYNVSYYASTDQEITPSDYFIGTKLQLGSLYAFHQTSADFAGTFPGYIPAGTYWVGWIIDSGGVVDEFDEGNNVGSKFIFSLKVETPDHTISGRVYTPPDQGISGVKMVGLPGTPVTNSNGVYSAVVPHQWAGTVTPQGCYDFSPNHRTYSKVLWNLTNQNFTAYVKDCSSQDDDCKTGYCNPDDGACHFNYASNGTPCDDGQWCTVDGECQHGSCMSDPRDCSDGLFCNGSEVCYEAGDTCFPGIPPQCNDFQACTIDSCEEGSDLCDHDPDDSLCDDGNVCTDDFCTIGAGCVHLPNDNACDDGLWCSVNDHCDGGFCVGDPRDCGDGIDCTGDSCIEQSQECVHNPRDAVCQDGTWCNGEEWCDVTEGCQTGTPQCPNDGIFCNGGEWCNEASDVCEHTRPPCNTGFGQTCDGRYETCDEAEDACIPSDATCPDNGLWCDGTELCMPFTGTCGHSTQVDGPLCPGNGTFCDGAEYCDEAGDQCLGTGDPCPDDQLFCNGAESCNEDTGGCDHLNPPDCDDGIPCTYNYCSPDADQCDYEDGCASITVRAVGPFTALPATETAIAVDLSAGLGVDRVAFEVAYADLIAALSVSYLGFDTAVCLTADWSDFDCTEDGDAVACSGGTDEPLGPDVAGCLVELHFLIEPDTWGARIGFDVTNLGEDLLLMTAEGHELAVVCEEDAECTDNVYCNGEEWCNEGVCADGEPVPCEDNGIFCDGPEVCDERTQGCISEGYSCPDDGLFCNGEEFCNEQAQGCDTAGDPCPDDGSFCSGVESCDEDADECVSTGYPCQDDGLFCNGREWCDDEADSCAHTGDPCADDGLFCNGEETCDEEQNLCLSTGDPCQDNGVFCDGYEHCDPATDQCVSSGDPCRSDGVFCNGVEYCDVALDRCTSSGDPCTSDGLFCNGEEYCNEESGACDVSDPCTGFEYCCEDDDYCSNDPCEPLCGCPEIDSITPVEGEHGTTIAVEITGRYFACQYREFKLVALSGERVFLQDAAVIDDYQVTGTFDLSEMPVGIHDVWVLSQECHDVLADGFEVVDGGWTPPWCGFIEGENGAVGFALVVMPLVFILGRLAVRRRRIQTKGGN